MNSAPLNDGHLMVIAAHAGDAENMAGALVLKHTRAGYRASIVHMTLGEAGHPTIAPNTYAVQRREEVAISARMMGADAIVLPYRDGELAASEEVKRSVSDLVREMRPTVILTHWQGSIHKDHIATHEIVRDAIFYAGLSTIQGSHPAHRVRGLYFPENWEDTEDWRADLYIDVGDVWDAYLEVLRSHALMRGGVSTFRYLEYYDALGTVRGCLAGSRKAVALMAPTGSWVRRLGYLPGFAPETGGC
jgi:LmbE family N-acetylglucosaminyl deacetylase